MNYLSYVKYLVALLLVGGLVYAALISTQVFSPEFFAGLSAAVIAFVFEKVPGIKDDWDKVPSEHKQNIMFLLMLLLVGAAFALSCSGLITAFACTTVGFGQAVFTLVIAIGANQGAYLLSRPVPAQG